MYIKLEKCQALNLPGNVKNKKLTKANNSNNNKPHSREPQIDYTAIRKNNMSTNNNE